MSWNQDGRGRADATGMEHLEGLYSYAMVLSRNHAEAEDLVWESIGTALVESIVKKRIGRSALSPHRTSITIGRQSAYSPRLLCGADPAPLSCTTDKNRNRYPIHVFHL